MWRHHGVRAGSNAVPMCWPVDEIVNAVLQVWAMSFNTECQQIINWTTRKRFPVIHALQPRTRRRGVAHVDVC